jgi:hypothetical protein
MMVLIPTDSHCPLTAPSMACMPSLTYILLVNFVFNLDCAFSLTLIRHGDSMLINRQSTWFDHSLEIHLQTCSIKTSKSMTKLAQSWSPCGAANNFKFHLQVNLQTCSITVWKCINKFSQSSCSGMPRLVVSALKLVVGGPRLVISFPNLVVDAARPVAGTSSAGYVGN